MVLVQLAAMEQQKKTKGWKSTEKMGEDKQERDTGKAD